MPQHPHAKIYALSFLRSKPGQTVTDSHATSAVICAFELQDLLATHQLSTEARPPERDRILLDSLIMTARRLRERRVQQEITQS